MTTVTVERIGSEAQPLVILDDFAPDPDSLRSFAQAADFAPALNHYPGVRADLPPSYLATQLPIIAAVAAQAFGGAGPVTVVDASFSIVSTPAGALAIPQRLPHIDAFTQDRIALVHYLSPTDGDGTAFFRHRSTGFETVDETKRDLFFRHLDIELRHGGMPPPEYISGDTRCSNASAPSRRAIIARCFTVAGTFTAARSPRTMRCRRGPTRGV